MGMLGVGILLIVLGVLVAATNAFGLAEIGATFVWLGWICLAIGVVLAILHFAMGPRTTVIERERRTI